MPPAAGSCAARRRGSATARTSRSTTRPTRSASSGTVLQELERDPKRFVPRGIHTQISNAKNALIGPEEYASRVASFYDQTVADTYALYQRRLFASNAVDFDDMLMLTVDVLQRFPEARERWAKTFRYVMVDEYQDTNHAQYVLLQLLTGEHGNLMGVGDPDQSVFSWRGADIRNILDFERDFPGTRTIALEQNYRSTNAILNAANAVISHNHERKEKRLWSELGEGEPVRVLEVEDEHAEARFVAAEIAGLIEFGYSLAEIAVVYRTNAQSRVLEDVLVRQGVDYQVIGGPRFYERAEVKDVIAYLQAIDNPYDAVSLTRIANKPRRGVGDTSLSRLQTLADGEGISLWEALGRADEAGLATASLRAVQSFYGLLQSLMSGAMELSVSELIERVLERSGYLDALEAERTIEARGRIENLEELVGVAREFEAASEEPSLSTFLQEISLYSDQDALRGDEGGGQVTLMTLHSAKARVPRGVHDRCGGYCSGARSPIQCAVIRIGRSAVASIRSSIAGAIALTAVVIGHAQAQRQLVIYCGVDEKWCRAVTNAYQKETGVQVDMTRMSAGEVYARVRAEKDNPHGDVWFGGTGDPHLQAADEKVTEPYQSPMLPNCATGRSARRNDRNSAL